LDDSRNELQEILQSLDATIGGRIASLHCRILEELQQNLITTNSGDKEQCKFSGNTQQHSDEKTIAHKKQKEEGRGTIQGGVLLEKLTTMKTKSGKCYSFTKH
jgi:hypothetical protein